MEAHVEEAHGEEEPDWTASGLAQMNYIIMKSLKSRIQFTSSYKRAFDVLIVLCTKWEIVSIYYVVD